MRQLTVGVPVYNGMPYLPATIDSILRQDFSDFELLVINDGSTDESREYLGSIKDPRLRIVDQENRGVTAARNEMLAQVKTPWLALHDADDIAYPSRLTHAADYINRFPDAGMFYALAEYYPVGSVGHYRTTRKSPAEIKSLVQSGYVPAVCNSTAVLNVERTKAVGGYRFNLYAVEDADLWWRMALHYDIHFIPELLVGYRQNAQSLSSSRLEEQAFNALYVQYLLMSHLWDRKPLAYEEVRGALSRLFSPKKVKFRNHLRAFNMELAQGNKVKALSQLITSFFVSPVDFMIRVQDECFPRREIINGESPKLFKKQERELWPENAAKYCPSFEQSLLPESRNIQ